MQTLPNSNATLPTPDECEVELDRQMHAAIDWMLRLDPAQATAADYLAFNAWLQADPRHAQIWQSVSGLLHQAPRGGQVAQGAGSRPARAPAEAGHLPRRTVVRGTLGLLLFGMGGAALYDRFTPVQGLITDRHTATGERRTLVLPDGSRLTLAPRTAVDIAFAGQQRRIRLHQGSLSVAVGPDPRRPLIVATAEGEVRAFGARFSARQEDGRSLISVQQHSVRLDTRGGYRAQLEAGKAAWLAGNTLMAAEPSLWTRSDWAAGVIEVRDEPLARVIEALKPYRRGILRTSEAVAQMRVSGSFVLDSSDSALQALGQSLPIEVRRYGDLLTLIDRR